MTTVKKIKNFEFLPKAKSYVPPPLGSTRVFKPWKGSVTYKGVRSGRSSMGKMHPLVASLYKRQRLRFGTERCMASRLTSISSTDLASILTKEKIRGGNPYRTRKQLMMKKLGFGQPVVSPACDHGIKYEPEALRVYAQVMRNQLAEEEVGWCKGPGGEMGVYVPPWIGATPDAVCEYLPLLVEIKCPFWKRVLTDEIPDLYWPQIQCQMAVTGLSNVHLAQYIPPDVMTAGEIVVTHAQFDSVWWMQAMPYIAKFYADLESIKKGFSPMPAIKQKRKRKKKTIPLVYRLINI